MTYPGRIRRRRSRARAARPSGGAVDVAVMGSERAQGDVGDLIVLGAAEVGVHVGGRRDPDPDVLSIRACHAQPEREDPTDLRCSSLRVDAEVDALRRDRIALAREWVRARYEEALGVAERALGDEDEPTAGREGQAEDQS